ncbi:MAG: hypothetical protein U0Q12_13905 [Vicinamibacterales bacterium]
MHGVRLSLLCAAIPAVVGSLLLMRLAGVGAASMLLQASAFGVGGAALALTPRCWWLKRSQAFGGGIAVVLVASLLIPLAVDQGTDPHRWVSLGGVRLYVAPLVIPSALRLLGHAVYGSQSRASMAPLASVIASLALLLQPDAAQLDAVACAVVPILWTSRLSRVARALTLGAITAGALAAWQRPDPLEPVRHVEGVFELAAQVGSLAFAASVCAAIGPTAALLWHAARDRDVGVLAVAVYYAVVLAHAPLLVTPVPLLGFGVGPILGYLLMAVAVPDRPTQVAHA